MPQAFNNPPAAPSSVGPQISNAYYQKKALIEAAKEQYFGQLADVTSMPKNMGKKIKRYHYLPLLDDANINDQGIDAAGATIANGNLYGSSKDIGTISGKLPVLSENGGRVNRVGFKRKEIEGTIEKFGFFDEYTQESLDFDTDADLLQHVNREMLAGANEITEDALQIDLINAAGIVKYAGNATSNATVGADDLVSYRDLMHLAIDLDNNPEYPSVRRVRFKLSAGASGYGIEYQEGEGNPIVFRKDAQGRFAPVALLGLADAQRGNRCGLD